MTVITESLRGESDHRIRGLDGLRAIAITLVFLGHATTAGRTLDLGADGVRLFFVLSGFLIVSILASQRRRVESGETTFPKAMRTFLMRRSLRIFPLYYVFIAAIAVAGSMGLDHWLTTGRLLVYATYTTNLLTWRWGNGVPYSHLWSLAVEEQFYLIAAPLLLLLAFARGKTACIATVLISIFAACTLGMLKVPTLQVYMDPFVNFGVIALGGVLSYHVRPRAGTAIWRPAAALITGVTLPLWLYLLGRYGLPRFALSLILEALISAWVIAEIIGNQSGWVTRALDYTPIRRLGRVSYGFYILHPIFIVPSFDAMLASVGIHVHVPVPVPQILEYAAVVLAATISWHILERPMQRLSAILGGAGRGH